MKSHVCGIKSHTFVLEFYKICYNFASQNRSRVHPSTGREDYITSAIRLLRQRSWIWKTLTGVCNTQFGLLDFFLWRIGKSGQFSFSLLWNREEKKQHYQVAKRLAKGNSSNYTIDFNSLPKRFQDWHNIYQSIKM